MIKKIGILILFLMFFVGCSTFQRIDDLDRRATILEEEREMGLAEGVGAATRMWGRDCIDGSCAAGKNLDDITAGGAGAIDGDVAIVPADPTYGFLIYLMDDDSAAAESLPNIVDPDTAGDHRWILQGTTLQKIFGKMYVSVETGDPVTVVVGDTGTMFINGDDDAIEFDLPADPTDLVYCFGNGHVAGTPVAQVITIDPDASDYIIYNGITAAQGEAIVSGGVGMDNICLIGLDASYWKVTGYIGGWAEATP
jgi:hypothetical protein